MKMSDFKGLLKKSVATVVSVENPHGDYYVVKMKPDSTLKWEAGEHGIFKLPNNDVQGKKWRAFSVASIPEEGVIKIGTRTGEQVSSFKSELIAMKKGDEIKITGPFGWFKIQDETSPLVLVAGGVGITPINALIKELEKNINRSVELVYSSKDYYLFEDEINTIIKSNDKLTLHKTTSRDETKKLIDEMTTKYKGEAYYYISGSRPFIAGVKKQMTATGIKSNRIINDPFFGY